MTQPRCDGCGKPQKGKKKPKLTLEIRLIQLQKEQERLEKLESEIAELKKKRGVKKGIEGQEGGEKEEEGDTPKWSSLTKGQTEA